MFHLSNFGKFAEGLKPFADLNGYVPQMGDSPEKMAYQPEPLDWEDFVACAIVATRQASHDLQDWQEGRRKPGPAPGSGKYGAGGGAKKLSARIEEEEILDWITSFPGGTAGVLRAAYANRRRLK